MERIVVNIRFGYCVSCKSVFLHVISVNVVSHAIFAYIVKLALPKRYQVLFKRDEINCDIFYFTTNAWFVSYHGTELTILHNITYTYIIYLSKGKVI